MVDPWGGDCDDPSVSGEWSRYSGGSVGCTTEVGVATYGDVDAFYAPMVLALADIDPGDGDLDASAIEGVLS